VAVHAAGCASDWSHFEVGDGVVGDLQVCFKVGVVDLLEVDGQLCLDFLGEVEEVELVALLLRQHAVDQLLKLLRAC